MVYGAGTACVNYTKQTKNPKNPEISTAAMAAFASVVGMVVSIKKTKELSKMGYVAGGRIQSFGKLIFSFPDENDCEASYNVNMLMLDG